MLCLYFSPNQEFQTRDKCGEKEVEVHAWGSEAVPQFLGMGSDLGVLLHGQSLRWGAQGSAEQTGVAAEPCLAVCCLLPLCLLVWILERLFNNLPCKVLEYLARSSSCAVNLQSLNWKSI